MSNRQTTTDGDHMRANSHRPLIDIVYRHVKISKSLFLWYGLRDSMIGKRELPQRYKFCSSVCAKTCCDLYAFWHRISSYLWQWF